MSKITGNENVYPSQYKGKDKFDWDEIKFKDGLTIRQHFAAMAMQGYCGGEFTGQSGQSHEELAEWCVKMADALIKELNKDTP